MSKLSHFRDGKPVFYGGFFDGPAPSAPRKRALPSYIGGPSYTLVRACVRVRDLMSVDIDPETIHIIESARFFRFLRAREFDAFVLTRNTIIVRPGLQHDVKLITHEVAHLAQMRREGWGSIRFGIDHERLTRRFGYWQNPYEVEARFVAGQK